MSSACAGVSTRLGRLGWLVRQNTFSASGQRAYDNTYLLDGADNNTMQRASQARRAEVVKPSVDAVQEFKVLTNSYSAEFGRAGGGVVSLSIKSGTNAIHGIVVVGGIVVLGTATGPVETGLGIVAVVFGAMNLAGGFVVTDRMLEMFRAKPKSGKN